MPETNDTSWPETNDTAWVVTPRPRLSPRLAVYCFPYAGSGPVVFRPWTRLLPEDVELRAVHLPGRGSRLEESPIRRVADAVHRVAPVVACSDVDFVFLGHSLGALLAFEVARWLRAAGAPGPRLLIASASCAPHLRSDWDVIHELPADEFAEAVLRLGGTPPEVFAEPELRDLVLPSLRADLEMAATYRYTSEPPLDCPISVYGGAQDATTTTEELVAWQAHTTASFRFTVVPGDHFFIRSPIEGMVADLRHELGALPFPQQTRRGCSRG